MVNKVCKIISKHKTRDKINNSSQWVQEECIKPNNIEFEYIKNKSIN